jgi:hypothetical protein
MSFDDELQRSLAAARLNAEQQEVAVQRTVAAGLRAFERVTTKVREAAAFLAAQNVPSVLFVDERIKPTFWSGEKKQQRTLASGWVLTPWLAISEDGRPWQVSPPPRTYTQLATSAPWDLEGMRRQITAGEEVILPLGGYTLILPSVFWDKDRASFTGDEDAAVQIQPRDYDSTASDLEFIMTHQVVELARTQGV